jgi:predicted phosphodiesterase
LKILIIADLHANAEALAALPQQYDQLWVLGDLVNYGPNPREIIDFVRSHADVVVRGNHDHAIGFNTDPRCSGPYKSMALEMGRFTQAILTEDEKAYLRSLPLSATPERDGVRFYSCHATPTDPLFAYCPPESEQWQNEANLVSGGYLLVGHTHLSDSVGWRLGREVKRFCEGRARCDDRELSDRDGDAGRSGYP